MRKLAKIEVPFYLLTLGLCMLEKGNTELVIFLFGVSFFRLGVNALGDEKNKSNPEGDL